MNISKTGSSATRHIGDGTISAISYGEPVESDVIRIEFGTRWKVPVYVAIGDEPTRKVSGPQDALQYLTDNRAIQTGFPYWRARHRCYDALKGLITPEEMRDDFIAACAQADFRLR